MKNQIEIIIEIIQEDQPHKHWFTSNEIYKAFQKHYHHQRIHDLIKRNNAGLPYFTAPYISSILFNYTTKPKEPKIQRRLNKNGIYEYSKLTHKTTIK